MDRKSERVRYMEAHFIELHEQGLSISEIAEKCNVSSKTIYSSLQLIADANNCTRESLLTQVHKCPAYWERLEKERIDAREIVEGFDNLIDEVKEIINKIDKIIQCEEDCYDT